MVCPSRPRYTNLPSLNPAILPVESELITPMNFSVMGGIGGGGGGPVGTGGGGGPSSTTLGGPLAAADGGGGVGAIVNGFRRVSPGAGHSRSSRASRTSSTGPVAPRCAPARAAGDAAVDDAWLSGGGVLTPPIIMGSTWK